MLGTAIQYVFPFLLAETRKEVEGVLVEPFLPAAARSSDSILAKSLQTSLRYISWHSRIPGSESFLQASVATEVAKSWMVLKARQSEKSKYGHAFVTSSCQARCGSWISMYQ